MEALPFRRRRRTSTAAPWNSPHAIASVDACTTALRTVSISLSSRRHLKPTQRRRGGRRWRPRRHLEGWREGIGPPRPAAPARGQRPHRANRGHPSRPTCALRTAYRGPPPQLCHGRQSPPPSPRHFHESLRRGRGAKPLSRSAAVASMRQQRDPGGFAVHLDVKGAST